MPRLRPMSRRAALGLLATALAAPVGGLVSASPTRQRSAAAASLPPGAQNRAFLPLVVDGSCQALPPQDYWLTPVAPESFGAETHPDINLAIRGYEVTAAARSLQDVNYSGSDPKAPQLAGLFDQPRAPIFRTVYRVYDWDWPNGRRGPLLSNWPVTLAGLAATSGEILRVPDSGYCIGDDEGFEVLVLYASEDRVTLKYTRSDNVIEGYTLHVESACVDPALVRAYREAHAAGRSQLPGLTARQAFGRARGDEVGVAIRDNGSFMDPRSRGDWWHGY